MIPDVKLSMVVILCIVTVTTPTAGSPAVGCCSPSSRQFIIEERRKGIRTLLKERRKSKKQILRARSKATEEILEERRKAVAGILTDESNTTSDVEGQIRELKTRLNHLERILKDLQTRTYKPL